MGSKLFENIFLSTYGQTHIIYPWNIPLRDSTGTIIPRKKNSNDTHYYKKKSVSPPTLPSNNNDCSFRFQTRRDFNNHVGLQRVAITDEQRSQFDPRIEILYEMMI